MARWPLGKASFRALIATVLFSRQDIEIATVLAEQFSGLTDSCWAHRHQGLSKSPIHNRLWRSRWGT